MFIDGGSTDVKQVGKYRILPFLKAKGVSEISYWFVSHTDTDHVSGLKEVLVSGYRVEYLVFAKAVEKEAKTKELAELARSHGTKVLYMQAGDTVRSKRAAMRCLYPKAADKAEDVNDLCLVLQFEEGDISALFGGDISTDVLYISSSGLRSLITLQKSVKQHNGQLVLEAMRAEIRKIFDMTGCSGLFIIR